MHKEVWDHGFWLQLIHVPAFRSIFFCPDKKSEQKKDTLPVRDNQTIFRLLPSLWAQLLKHELQRDIQIIIL